MLYGIEVLHHDAMGSTHILWDDVDTIIPTHHLCIIDAWYVGIQAHDVEVLLVLLLGLWALGAVRHRRYAPVTSVLLVVQCTGCGHHHHGARTAQSLVTTSSIQ